MSPPLPSGTDATAVGSVRAVLGVWLAEVPADLAGRCPVTGRKVRILCPGGHGIGALTWSGHGWELALTSALLKPHPIWPKDTEPTHTDLRQLPPLDLARLTEDEPPPPAASQAYVGLRHTWLLNHLPDLFETGCPRCQLNLLLDIAGLRRHVAAHRRPYRLPANTPCRRPPQMPPRPHRAP